MVFFHPCRDVCQATWDPCSYRWIIWFKREIELCVISVAMVGEAMCLYDGSQWCSVCGEEEGSKNRSLKNPSDQLMIFGYLPSPGHPERPTSEIRFKPAKWNPSDVVYVEKRRGPRTNPWGTQGVDRRIWWLTVSIAADRSSRMRTDDLESAFAVRRASVTESSAVSVEWPLLKPDRLVSSLLFCERNNETCLKTTHSSVLAMNGRRETGLYFSKREVFNRFFEQWCYPSLLECSGEDACGERCVDDVCECCKSEGEIAWRRCEGIASRGHVVGWLEKRSLDTSASVRGQKEKMGVWAVDVVGWRSYVCGGENWLLIVLVLSVKKWQSHQLL